MHFFKKKLKLDIFYNYIDSFMGIIKAIYQKQGRYIPEVTELNTRSNGAEY